MLTTPMTTSVSTATFRSVLELNEEPYHRHTFKMRSPHEAIGMPTLGSSPTLGPTRDLEDMKHEFSALSLSGPVRTATGIQCLDPLLSKTDPVSGGQAIP
jgi:hypothetical protein